MYSEEAASDMILIKVLAQSFHITKGHLISHFLLSVIRKRLTDLISDLHLIH